MAEVHFTTLLYELVPDGPLSAQGETVREVFAQLFAEYRELRSYILDEQGQATQTRLRLRRRKASGECKNPQSYHLRQTGSDRLLVCSSSSIALLDSRNGIRQCERVSNVFASLIAMAGNKYR